MANILLSTEAFDATADWPVGNNATVTADVAAPPSIASAGAGLADQINDTNSGTRDYVQQGRNGVIPNDSSNWIASGHILKDAVTSRFPELRLIFHGGTQVAGGVQINTNTGAIADEPTFPPAASGILDIDANWWRLWVMIANNSSGNVNFGVSMYAAIAATLGGAEDPVPTGSVTVWGFNLTNTSVLQPYVPWPAYRPLFSGPRRRINPAVASPGGFF